MPKPRNTRTPATLAKQKQDFFKSLEQQALARDKNRGQHTPPTFHKTLSAPSREQAIRVAAKQPRLIDGNRTIHFISGVKRMASLGIFLDHPNIRLPYPAQNEIHPGEQARPATSTTTENMSPTSPDTFMKS